MNEGHVREALRSLRDGEGGRALSDRIGISEAFLSRVILGRDPPSPKLLTFLGLRRVVTYEKDDASSVVAEGPNSGGGVARPFPSPPTAGPEGAA